MNLVKTNVMVSMIWQVTIKPSGKKDHVAFVVKKTTANAVLCISWGNCYMEHAQRSKGDK